MRRKQLRVTARTNQNLQRGAETHTTTGLRREPSCYPDATGDLQQMLAPRAAELDLEKL